MKIFKSSKTLRKSMERFLNAKKGKKNQELITCVHVHFRKINSKPVHRMFRHSGIVSTNHKITKQLKFQSCFGIGGRLKSSLHYTNFLMS